MYTLTHDKLLFDLYTAFECARRHKSNKPYVRIFEKNLHKNLCELCDELFERTYVPQPSVCFIISKPKKREVFAANFRDRIVHHLYYNYTYNLFERTFIDDSYSCRVGKGIHYGIKRLDSHLRSESDNFRKNVYVLKMDIKGYFIHINRKILLDLVNSTLDRMCYRKCGIDGYRWCETVDFDFIRYLSKEIILLDPTKNCIFRSQKKQWGNLPKSKSLFSTDADCGLPIGNLTSQLFSNVYLNVLDQYIKRNLNAKHYGRYVDDFYVVSDDKVFLRSIIPHIKDFLKNTLALDVNQGKTKISTSNKGVEFLGAYVKPFRTYISKQCLKRIKEQLYEFDAHDTDKNIQHMINSFSGVFNHHKSYNIRSELFNNIHRLNMYGFFNKGYTKFIPYI